MMLGGSPPRPALQPGVHGIGALSSAPSTRSTRRPTSSTGRRRAFPPPMPGPRASISLGPRSALSFARRVPLLPHGRAQPARTSRELLCSYSSMAPWNFSSRVLPLSYLKQQVGCPHDCALSLLLPKPTSPAPTLFPTKQQPQRAAVNLAQQPRRQFTQPHGFSLCRALGVLDEMPQQQQRRPSLRRTRQDGPHAIDLRSICASSSKPAVSSSLFRVP
jgi:hypothetical protein